MLAIHFIDKEYKESILEFFQICGFKEGIDFSFKYIKARIEITIYNSLIIRSVETAIKYLS